MQSLTSSLIGRWSVARCSVAQFAAALFVALAAGGAHAQSYPDKAVKATVSVAPGTASDVLARFVMDALSRSTGKNFFVENRPGAGGNIALAAGAKAPPDGYSVQFSGLGQQIMNPLIYSSPGWESKDFDPVIMVARVPYMVLVGNDVAAKNLQELIALSKTNPDKLNIAVTTSTSRVALDLLRKTSGLAITPVAYNSVSAATVDVISGRVTAILETTSAMQQHVDSGKLRPIAITTLKTSPLAPNVRTISEQGVPQFGEFVGWTAMFVPRGTPPEIVTWLNTEMNKVLATPETRKRIAELGAEAGSGTPQELASYIAAERVRWTPIIREAGIKAN